MLEEMLMINMINTQRVKIKKHTLMLTTNNMMKVNNDNIEINAKQNFINLFPI